MRDYLWLAISAWMLISVLGGWTPRRAEAATSKPLRLIEVARGQVPLTSVVTLQPGTTWTSPALAASPADRVLVAVVVDAGVAVVQVEGQGMGSQRVDREWCWSGPAGRDPMRLSVSATDAPVTFRWQLRSHQP